MTTSPKAYDFKVNGEEFTTENPAPSALEILEIAKNGKAIPGSPKDYALQGQKGEYRENDKVDLVEDNVFITVPVGATPVA
ncbi:MAG: hypothetical protein OXD46_04960 [Chloroflexi bacterium]|nr:hypothetical protein [Chloroflexota bacterium]